MQCYNGSRRCQEKTVQGKQSVLGPWAFSFQICWKRVKLDEYPAFVELCSTCCGCFPRAE